MRRTVILLALLACLFGCGGPDGEEAKAATELAPKPMTTEQKQALEDVKTKFPGAAPAHAGAGM